jgi:hypothetical protein
VHLLKLVATLVAVSLCGVAAAQADTSGPPWGPETPHFNLEVILRPAAGGPEKAFGHVKFREPNDAATIIDLDTWVRDLAPNHDYYLERAVDTMLDGSCGGSWLRLGQGTTIVPITTDDRGTGRAALYRGLPANLLGVTFDIHFQVVDAVTNAAVLESGCYRFTVSQ